MKRTAAEMSKRMKALAEKKIRKMTRAQRTEHGKLMARARGQWINGVYVKTKRD